jgi:hypothetical protein
VLNCHSRFRMTAIAVLIAVAFAFQAQPAYARMRGFFAGAIVGGVASAITHTTRSLTVRRSVHHSRESHRTETSAHDTAEQAPVKSTDEMAHDYGPSATSSGGGSGLSSYAN